MEYRPACGLDSGTRIGDISGVVPMGIAAAPSLLFDELLGELKGGARTWKYHQIQWLYKAAPKRQSEPLVDQDVDSNGSGLVPVALSSSARQRGWTQLVKTPVQNWNSSELESFLERYFYGNRSFREVLPAPLLFFSVIPIIFLYGVILMRREIVEESKQLYASPFGDDLIFDLPALWTRCNEQMTDWKDILVAGAKANLSGRRSEPKGRPFAAAM